MWLINIKNNMNILSLFDGISCARVALEKSGIKVDNYFASEVDKYAAQISEKNYPDIIRLGDVREICTEEGLTRYLPNIDLMIGGSPCQDLSIAKKDRKGLEGERSGLFWQYVLILSYVKPKYFILENVASMSKESKQLITDTLGVEPIMLDASLVSAQSRKRLFWTNIPNITLPNDLGLVLKDILQENVDDSFYLTEKQIDGINKSNYNDRKPTRFDKKSKTLKVGGDIKRVILPNGKWRYLTPTEYCRLQGLPDTYTEGVSKTQQYKGVGNAFHVDIISHILSFIK